MIFNINGTIWHLEYKSPNADELMRSDGTFSFGVTDRNVNTIYISSQIRGPFLRKVCIHEICHAFCMSYNIFLPIEQEEILCDFVATHGEEVFEIVDMLLNTVCLVA